MTEVAIETGYPVIYLDQPREEIDGIEGLGRTLDILSVNGIVVRDDDLFSGFNAQPLLNGEGIEREFIYAVTTEWWFGDVVFTRSREEGIPISHAYAADYRKDNRVPAVGVYDRQWLRRTNSRDFTFGEYALRRNREGGVEQALKGLIILPPAGL